MCPVRCFQAYKDVFEIQYYVGLDKAPDVLVLNASGNELGVQSSRELMRDIKKDLLTLWASYPGNIIVWSEMVALRVWRQARSL